MKPTAPLRGSFSVLATDPRQWITFLVRSYLVTHSPAIIAQAAPRHRYQLGV